MAYSVLSVLPPGASFNDPVMSLRLPPPVNSLQAHLAATTLSNIAHRHGEL